MLHVDILRGEDSTGVAVIKDAFGKAPKAEIYKSVGSPTEFFWQHGKGVKRRDLTNGSSSVWIGHNRHATQGKIDEAGAHPFEFDNVIGAHNGTVLQSSLKDFEGYKTHNIDSQIIFSHLSHTGSIDEVWKDADGAMALVWWDKQNNKLNLIRNNQRDLWFGYSKDDKTVFWASEPWMIWGVAGRQGNEFKDLVQLVPNRLYTFELGEQGKMSHIERDLPPFVVKPRLLSYNQNQGRGYSNNSSEDCWEDWYTVPTKEKGPAKNNVTKISPPQTLVIREIHDNKAAPAAIGYRPDGTEVRVIIPLNIYKEAKNKILGRGMASGYYTVPKFFESSLKAGGYWCHWGSLNYVKFWGDGGIIRKEDGAYEIKPNAAHNSGHLAPYFPEGATLNISEFVEKTYCGCLSCLEKPKWESRKVITWVNEKVFVCEKCIEMPFVQDTLVEYENQRSA